MSTVVGEDHYDSNDRSHRTHQTRINTYRRQHADLPPEKWENREFSELIRRYKQCLLEQNVVDFDMIVEGALRLLLEEELVRQSLFSKFPWIAVDEYQDLGYPLFRIVTELIDHTPMKLFAIGDPDQAIFDFQGTDPRYLLELAERPDVQPVVELNTNYRSSYAIIETAKAILQPYCNYEADDEEKTGFVYVHEHGPRWEYPNRQTRIVQIVERYLDQDVPAHSIAILHRWRSSGANITAETLRRENIPYVLDKHPLYDRSMILIRWLEDLAYWCLVGWQNHDEKRVQFDDLLRIWEEISLQKSENNQGRVLLAATLWNLSGHNWLVGDWLSHLSRDLALEEALDEYRSIYPDEVAEYERLCELVSDGGELSHLQLTQFANAFDGVHVTTLHSSKGMQFDVVIIAGIENVEKTPNGRRLLYVGATRAKRYLHLLYNKWDWDTETRQIPIYIDELLETCTNWEFFRHFPL